MVNHVDVAIIGAGSAGLSALSEVQKVTDNFLLIDHGPLGSTCARVGCMPSKVLIHIANAYHARRALDDMGIAGADNLRCDLAAVLKAVRAKRDRFTSGMVKSTYEEGGDRFIKDRAVLVSPNRIQVGDELVKAERIIIATGASPWVPRAWQPFSEHILTSLTIFEQEVLPERMAVIGLGAIGLELGQALSRLGIEITGFNLTEEIGGLSDPKVNSVAKEFFAQEFALHTGEAAQIKKRDGGLDVYTETESATVDKVLVAMGVRPNVDKLGVEKLNVELNEQGVPQVDPRTLQIADLPIYLAGDANGYAPLLHEALDEGFIAGRRSFEVDGHSASYCRRIPLRIVFSDPQCAVVGQSFATLRDQDIVIGEVDFSRQSRALLESRDRGLLRLYADAVSGRILGAEMVAPEAEHLAFVLASWIQAEMTVPQALRLPFYHPVFEEGLRIALHNTASKLPEKLDANALNLCGSCPDAVLQ